MSRAAWAILARMGHHTLAWWIVAASAFLILLDGLLFSMVQHIALWHGIYCIWMTAITVGGDVQPVRQGYACLAFAPFPLLAAAFSLFTSALANIHIRRTRKEIMDQANGNAEEIKSHVTETVGPAC